SALRPPVGALLLPPHLDSQSGRLSRRRGQPVARLAQQAELKRTGPVERGRRFVEAVQYPVRAGPGRRGDALKHTHLCSHRPSQPGGPAPSAGAADSSVTPNSTPRQGNPATPRPGTHVSKAILAD